VKLFLHSNTPSWRGGRDNFTFSFYSVPVTEVQNLQVGHDRFFPHPFIYYSQLSHHSTLTTCSRVLLKKLIITQLVKKFPPFMEPVFTRDCHWPYLIKELKLMEVSRPKDILYAHIKLYQMPIKWFIARKIY
jgi:hypothetical protein